MTAVDFEEFAHLGLMVHDGDFVHNINLHNCLLRRTRSLPRHISTHIPIQFILKIRDLLLTNLIRFDHMCVKVGSKVVHMSTNRIPRLRHSKHADHGNILPIFLQRVVVAVNLHEFNGSLAVVEVGGDRGSSKLELVG